MVGFNKYSDVLTQSDYAVAGAGSGILTRALCQPLDVVKIRFQLQVEPIRFSPDSKYKSLWQAVNEIYKEEGWKAFWKGHVPAQMLSIVYGLVQFWTFEFMTNNSDYWRQKSEFRFKYAISFICGSAAGVTATVASFPFDVLRTRLVAQSERHKYYKGLFHTARDLFEKEGRMGFYRGLSPTLLQVAPHAGLQFLVYNTTDQIFRRITGFEFETHELVAAFFAGSVAGIVAKTAIYPFDLMRKRLQIQGFLIFRTGFGKPFTCSNLIQCVIFTFKTEGIQGMFKGLLPSMMKASSTTAMNFCCYESICNILYNLKS